ncbi:MAG: hypothetical protein ACYC37_00100 [Desulfobacteria bacterium]|nr:hypothetical protein [Deltaproteobacteria bacterium]
MSDRTDTLLLELVDLARGQRAAIKEGRLDEALSFLEKRRTTIDRIQDIGRLTENQRMAVKDILSIDEDISTAVRCSMSDVASRLTSIEKIRTYLQSVSSTGEDKQVGVTI